MKNPPDDIEQELSRLHPSMPGHRLEQRLEAALSSLPPARAHLFRPTFWSAWRILAAAATVALAILAAVAWQWLSPRPTYPAENPAEPTVANPSPPEQGKDHLTQVYAANYLFHAEDTGIIYASQTIPLRKIKYQFLDASEYQDKDDNLTVQVLVPREEIMLIPIQVY